MKKPRFRNVVLCDDIREEIGNKKSLMGVLSGDIQVPEFPANIHLAVYLEYVSEEVPGGEIQFELRLFQDETEIVKLKATANLAGRVGTLAVPRAIVVFEKACKFRIVASSPGTEDWEELLSKRVSAVPAST